MRVCAVILAAGYSSRMGEFKPLLKLGPATVIEAAVSIFRKAGIGDVRVMVGHRRELIEKVLQKDGVKIIVNHDFGLGMFSSVLCGIRDLEPDIGHVFIHPADIPLVRPATIAALWENQSQEKVSVPVFAGRRGHPALIPKQRFAQILAWSGDDGLRGALRALGDNIFLVPVDDPRVLTDLDTPEDYRRLKLEATQS